MVSYEALIAIEKISKRIENKSASFHLLRSLMISWIGESSETCITHFYFLQLLKSY